MTKATTASAAVPAQKRRFLLTAAIIAILVIAIAIFATLIAYRIPWAFDMTAGKVFTLSDQSRGVLAGLTDPVEIIAIYPQDGADPMLSSLLEEYSKASPLVDVKYIDAERQPGRLAAENVGVAAVTNGTVIVRSGDKTKFVYQADMFQDTQEGKMFWGERELTGALRYVTAASMPRVYFLEGHGEASTSADLSKAQSALELAVYDAQPLSLVKTGSVPKDAAMVIVASPRSDLSESEYKALEEYLANGGKAMFLVSPVNTNKMVLGNFNKLLNQYGLDISNNLVVEEDDYSHVTNNKLYLIPGYAYHTITRALAEAKKYVILPIAMGLLVKDVDPSKVTQEPLLATSPKAWMRTDLSIKSETQTGQDVAGPIPLAYAVTRQADAAGTDDSRIVALGNSTFIYNENLDSNANRDFFLSAVNWLLGGRGEESISPRVIGAEKLIVRGTDFVKLAAISLVFLPAIAFVGAFLMWYLRRNQ
jgi:ABC-2 type transport system permease protein